MEGEKVIKPIYHQIAIDIANRIVNGEIKVGSKLSGRSVFASRYGVSPETIRRAIKLLEDVNIVNVKIGTGIVIESKEKAQFYIQQFQVVDSVNSIKKDIKQLIKTREKVEQDINNSINKLLGYSQTFKNINPFTPFEILVTESSPVLNKTIAEVNFWHNTGATIIGIRREGQVILSPGPYAIFLVDDYIIIVGDETSYYRCCNFINSENESVN